MPTITVTSLADSGAGSLRQAILDAAAGDTIRIATQGTLTLTSGQLVIDKSLTIQGQGASQLTISGGGASRILKVEGAAPTVVLNDLSLANGFVANTGDNLTDGGGAIQDLSRGSLTLQRVHLRDNHARAGGAIMSMEGHLRITDSTLSGNQALFQGGAIFTLSDTRIDGATIAGNTAGSRGGGIATGLGVGDPVIITSSTIAGNNTRAWGGGLDTGGGTAFVYNSILADNQSQLFGANELHDTANGIYLANSLIENYVPDFGIQLLAPIISGIDPGLGPLADNGGPVPTMLPSRAGPAIDAGNAAAALLFPAPSVTDARGLPRIAGRTIDLGAVELQPLPALPAPVPPPPDPPPSSAVVIAPQFANRSRFANPAYSPLPATVTTPDGRVLPNPLLEQQKAVAAIVAKVDAGSLTRQAALDQIVHLSDGTTSVATLTYQFFTGRLPSKDGLDYLVSSPLNPTDLNDGFYAGLSLENRYINFAVNLGKGGDGAAAFLAGYGALSLGEATAKAYAEIFGKAADAPKLAGILTPDRAGYFASLGGDALGAKAAMVGWLLAEAVKSDLGPYAAANEAFLYDLADGAAAFGANAAVYLGAAPTTVALVGWAEA